MRMYIPRRQFSFCQHFYLIIITLLIQFSPCPHTWSMKHHKIFPFLTNILTIIISYLNNSYLFSIRYNKKDSIYIIFMSKNRRLITIRSTNRSHAFFIAKISPQIQIFCR